MPLYSSINVSLEPQLKDKLLQGEINKVICPRCREAFFAGRFLLYHDVEKNFMIWMAPKVKGVFRDDNKNMESERRIQRRREMKNFALLTVVVMFGLTLFSGCASMTGRTAGEYIDDAAITTAANAIIIKDPDAQYLKIDVTTTQGNVVLDGFVNNKETGERLVGKIRQIRGVKSVKSLLKVEEKK